MKELYAKYQNNKHLFVIPLFILIFALYFMPIFIQFPYTNDNLVLELSLFGDFISLIFISNNYFIVPFISLFIFILSIIFAFLSYKKISFGLGSSAIALWHFIYIGLFINDFYHNDYIKIAFGQKEKLYLSFSVIMSIVLLIYSLFLFLFPICRTATDKVNAPIEND